MSGTELNQIQAAILSIQQTEFQELLDRKDRIDFSCHFLVG